MQSSWTQDLLVRLSQWMPPEVARVVIALAIVIVGYVLARLVGALVTRIFHGASLRFVSLLQGGKAQEGLPSSDGMSQAQQTGSKISGRVGFWLVFTLFLGAGTAVLGFPVLSTWMESLASYLPRVLAAVAILLLGVLSGLFVRAIVVAATEKSGMTVARSLGRAAQVSIVLLAGVMAIEELGVGVTSLLVIATILLGTSLGGAALAFGLGARHSVSNLLACHYLAKWYRVGQIIRIKEQQGRIIEILPSAVIVQTEAGKLYIPARDFASNASLLVAEEEV